MLLEPGAARTRVAETMAIGADLADLDDFYADLTRAGSARPDVVALRDACAAARLATRRLEEANLAVAAALRALRPT